MLSLPIYLLSEVVKHTCILTLWGRSTYLYTYSLRSLSTPLYLRSEPIKQTYILSEVVKHTIYLLSEVVKHTIYLLSEVIKHTIYLLSEFVMHTYCLRWLKRPSVRCHQASLVFVPVPTGNHGPGGDPAQGEGTPGCSTPPGEDPEREIQRPAPGRLRLVFLRLKSPLGPKCRVIAVRFAGLKWRVH